MDEGSKQPSDYATPQERVEDPRYRVAGKVVSALSKPGSVLLFVVVVLAIIGIADWMEYKQRSIVLLEWMDRIEDHRAEEIQQCNNNMMTISESCIRELGKAKN